MTSQSGPLAGQKAEGQLFSSLLGDVSMLAGGFLGTESSPQQLCWYSWGCSLHCGVLQTQDVSPGSPMVLPGPFQLCFQERLVAARWSDKSGVGQGTLCQ